MKQFNIDILSPSSIMFGIAYEKMILPHPGFKDDVHLKFCTEFRIGLLFLQLRFRVF